MLAYKPLPIMSTYIPLAAGPLVHEGHCNTFLPLPLARSCDTVVTSMPPFVVTLAAVATPFNLTGGRGESWGVMVEVVPPLMAMEVERAEVERVEVGVTLAQPRATAAALAADTSSGCWLLGCWWFDVLVGWKVSTTAGWLQSPVLLVMTAGNYSD